MTAQVAEETLQTVLERRVLRSLAKRSLSYFCEYAGEGLWKHAAHLDLLCKKVEEVEQWINEDHDEVKLLMVVMPPRHGKQCADSTPVLTIDGWKTHGKLVVGDQVFGPNGQPTRIIALSESSIADHQVCFVNGEIIKCHANHEWTVYDRSCARWKTVETSYLAHQRVWSGNRARFLIPDIAAIEFPEAKLLMDPYALGVWLGDESSSKPHITISEEDAVHVIPAIASAGYKVSARWVHKDTGIPTYSFGGSVGVAGRMTSELQSLGVWKNKHIPRDYIESSIPQRLLLLAGLIDTYGNTEADTGRVRIVTGDRILAEGISDLCSSLGFRPHITKQKPSLSTSGIQGRKVVYTVGFQPNLSIPVRLSRKVPTLNAVRRRVGIRSVNNAEKESGRCIQVDRPDGLYLVGRKSIPTHNSEVISRHTPPWFLGRNPDKEIILASYGAELATDMSRDARRIFRDVCPELFDLQVSEESAAVGRWHIKDHKGRMQATGAGGPITGRGADLAIIDDPVKNIEEAESPVYQRKLMEWFKTTLLTRLAPGGAVILVMTRWHMQDLGGRLLKEAKATGVKWEVVKFPASAEEDDDVLGRKKGDALWPWRYNKKALAKIKRIQANGRFWAGLYQGNPEGDVEGALWKRETMIDPYRVAEAPELEEIGLGIDPSGGSEDTNDEVGMVLGGRTESGRGIVLADISGRYTASPNAWAVEALHICLEYKVNWITAEKNFGGDMVLAVILLTKVKVKEECPECHGGEKMEECKRCGGRGIAEVEHSGSEFMSEDDLVTASRAKHIRAEPIANLYSQGEISHVGELTELEHEQCTWIAQGPKRSKWSPNRMDALVWVMTKLMVGASFVGVTGMDMSE